MMKDYKKAYEEIEARMYANEEYTQSLERENSMLKAAIKKLREGR